MYRRLNQTGSSNRSLSRPPKLLASGAERAGELHPADGGQYAVLFEEHPQPMWVFDHESLAFLAVNEAAIREYGYSREEFLGMTIKDIRPAEEAGRLLDALAKSDRLPGRPSAKGEWKLLSKDGVERDVEIVWNRVTFQGHAARLAVVTDITERKRAQAEAEQCSQKMNAVIESITDSFLTLDRQWRITSINQRAEKNLGKRRTRLLGQVLWQVFPLIKQTEFYRLLKKAMAEQAPAHGEAPCPGAPERWFELHAYPSPKELTVYFRNISQRKHAEAQLRSSEERFRQLAEHIDAVFFMADATEPARGKIVYASPAYEKIWGRSCAYLYRHRQSWLQAVHPEDRPRVRAAAERMARGEFDEEFRIQRPDRTLRWVQFRAFPILDERGEVTRIAGLVTDITSSKQLEQELEGKNDTLRATLEDLRAREAELRATNQGLLGARQSLEAERQRYQSLFDLAPDGYLVTDASGTIRSANRAAAKLLGTQPGLMVGYPIAHFIEPKERRSFVGKLTHLGRATIPQRWEVRICPKNRPAFDASISVAGLTYDASKSSELRWLVRDITCRKEAERALRQSEERYRAFVQTSTEAIWRHELEQPVPIHLPPEQQLDWLFRNAYLAEGNAVLAQIHDFDRPDQMIGMRIGELLAPNSALNQKVVSAFVRDGYRATDVESVVTDRHGREKYTLSNVVGVVENGLLVRLWGTTRDITERKQWEQALQESEARFRQLANTVPAVVWTTDAAGRCNWINDKWLEYSGLTFEQSLGFGWLQSLPPDGREQGMRRWEEIHRRGEPYEVEGRFRRADGEYRWFLIRAEPLRDFSGRITGWFGTNLDIQARKEAEEALQVGKRQADHIATELEKKVTERTAKLQDSIQSLEGVLYHVAHDLRAPLRAMQGFTTILLQNYAPQLDPTGEDYARRVADAANRMDQLIQDLLNYGRLCHQEPAGELIDLNRWLDQLLRQFAGEIEAKGASVEVTRPLPVVWANPTVLDQIFSNLFTNALKFVAPGVVPRIRFRAEARDHLARIWVEDNGIGIEPQYQERIFRVFERLHPPETYPGTGIGLAIVQKGVERLGGHVGLESAPGAGSRFWVELPTAPKG